MSSIDLDAIDVGASSDSRSLHSSDSEVEVEVTGKEEFPCVTPAALLQLVVEKDQYNIAASNADAGYDLWAFWHDNRLMPAWYDVAKDAALIQPSSAFMERVFSILRACMDERQESCYSDRIAASALLKYNRGRKRIISSEKHDVSIYA